MVDPGNNLNGALNVGNLSSLRTFTDFVGTADQIDVYRFNLTQTSNFSLNLGGLGANAEVYLVADLNQNGVRDSGENIYSSTNWNSNDETINATLGAGSYFAWIQTNHISYNTNYDLSLSATATPPTTTSNPGNDLNSALNVGNLSSLKTFKDFVGTVDRTDIYRFSLTQTSSFSLNLSGLDANAEVYLVADLNQNGVRDSGENIYSSTNWNSNDEAINATLGAGSYFAWIQTDHTSYNTNYDLSLSATATPPTTTSNPGNDLNSALNVGNLSSLKTFKDFVGTVDRTDIYRFSLTQTSSFSLNLSGLDANAEVYLVADLNQNGVRDSGENIYSSTNWNSNDEAINATLGAGSYFAWIQTDHTSYNTNYDLSLSATATPPTTTSNPGNDLNSALNVGNLSSLKTFKDFVGTVDRTDIYRFSLTQTSSFSLNLSGLDANAEVYLVADLNQNGVRDSGENIYSSTNWNSNDEAINATLGAGSYFAWIQTDHTSYNTNYDLSLSATVKTPSSNDDYMVGNYDNEVIDALAGNDYIESRFGNDNLNGGSGNDSLFGEGDDDTLFGGLGDDFLDGGFNNDSLVGGLGNDTYVLDNISDVIVEKLNEGTDTVITSFTYTLGANLEKLTLTDSDSINGIGNSLSNQIGGNSSANLLDGGLGNDLLAGGEGHDTVIGGAGNDIIIGGIGNDLLAGGTGIDNFIYDSNAAFARMKLGRDRIVDFAHLTDKIVLDKTTFTALTSIAGNGFSVASEFAVVTSDAAVATAKALIVYSSGTGNMFYNENGAAIGLGSGDQFTTLKDVTALSASDFLIRA